MKTVAGLWIDHSKAVIVVATDKGDEIKVIVSNVEKHLGRSHGVRSTSSYEAQLVPADDSRERRLTGQLNMYYDAVIASMQGAEEVLLFGPGEAKGELKKRINQKNKGSMRVVATEPADKMTDRQVAAKVRHYFEKSAG
jgi:stalled ribosome rescue protein Dom34